MTLTVYHAPPSRSVRILWLLEEMGVPYETKTFPIRGDYMTSDDFRAINPTAKVPAIDDDGLILFESVAIMEYLLAKHGAKGLAPEPSDRLYGPYLQWLHYGEAGMGPYVTMCLGHRRLLPEAARIPAMAQWGEDSARHCLDVLAGQLSAHDYLLPTGFSAADISVAYMLLLAKFAGIMKHAPEPVTAYFDRCTARESWKVASASPEA
ncbi:glutathione S-transferase family protein [Parvularcula oceani]|uniref:glutathione S-transferase family protein n=1 Tax=Parvularcula oceani TaxID=1247963 RepID=UPI00068AA657|nr:glutathione S-transferase family protein [Parvularcula oceani]